MKRISIEEGWRIFWKLRGDAEFHSELHKEQVLINYWKGKGYKYENGEVI